MKECHRLNKQKIVRNHKHNEERTNCIRGKREEEEGRGKREEEEG